MLQARLNLITADPLRLGDMVKFVAADLRRVAESMPDNLGVLLAANREAGVAVLESFWASRVALVQSTDVLAPARQAAVRQAGGTVAVERYRVPVFEGEARLSGGAGLRLTRMDIEPSRTDDLIQAYGDSAVPLLAETLGFCCALLLADRRRGHAVSETIWRTPQALAASRSVAATVRGETVLAAGCEVRQDEEYDLLFSSARKA